MNILPLKEKFWVKKRPLDYSKGLFICILEKIIEYKL